MNGLYCPCGSRTWLLVDLTTFRSLVAKHLWLLYHYEKSADSIPNFDHPEFVSGRCTTPRSSKSQQGALLFGGVSSIRMSRI